MLNRIVITEKEKIFTLKVIEDLRHADLQKEMQTFEHSLASSNSRKVILDLNNLQVISLAERQGNLGNLRFLLNKGSDPFLVDFDGRNVAN